MISEILNKCVKKTNKNHIEVDFDRFKNLDDIILEKLIKKFYQYFYNKSSFLRSKKIAFFLNKSKEDSFTLFNLKGMIIKKVCNSLIFSKISN